MNPAKGLHACELGARHHLRSGAAAAFLPALMSLLLSGCAADFGSVVNVGPSGERHVEEIAAAVDEMNVLLGADVFSVRMVDSDEMIDGEIIVRHRADPFRVNALARTNLTRRGIAIYVRDVCDARCVLHELGHAGGLVEHSRDPNNLMFHNERGGSYLTDRQIDRVLTLTHGGPGDD